jgi:hypothetical protein
MPPKWDPLAKSPGGAGQETLGWYIADLAAFQSAHPELPQGDTARLSDKQRRRLIAAYSEARDRAELEEARRISPKHYEIVERAQRTGWIESPVAPGDKRSSKAKAKKKPRR